MKAKRVVLRDLGRRDWSVLTRARLQERRPIRFEARAILNKRACIVLYDAASALAVALVLSFAFAAPAYAYIDPSVMTYTIQAVAGVAVALSAVAGVAFRRGRKHLYRLLDIDENAKREFEPDVHRVGVAAQAAVQAEPQAASVAAVQAELQTASGAALQAEPQAASVAAVQAELQTASGAALQVEPQVASVAAVQAEAASLEGAAVSGEAAAPDDAATVDEAAQGGDAPESAGSSTPESAGGDAPETQEAPAKRKRKRKRKRMQLGGKPYKPTWKERMAFGAMAAFFFVFTIYFVAPLEIVAGASADLVYSMQDVWWVLVPPGLGLVVGITLVLSVFRGRAFGALLGVVCAVGLSAYLQALVMNVGLPAADGNTIVWSDYLVMGIISAVVWVGLIAAAVICGILWSRRTQGVVVIVSAFLVLVQAVGLCSLVIAPPSGSAATSSGGKAIMTEDQMYTVNPNHNVIVFVLDTYDTAYLSRVLDMDPNLLDGLTGFTNYENATSAMIPTRFAIPEMLTGQMPGFDEPFSVYKDQRYARSSYLDDIYGANYSIGLYTDSMRISALSSEEQYSITSKTVNIHDLPDSMIDYGGTLYSLYQMGQYRDALWAFKWAFWYYTDQINQAMVVSDESLPPEETAYVIDDVRYYNRLCDLGLSLEEGDYDGAFRFIHLLGSHYPFSYDEEVNDLGEDNSNVFKQSRGAIHIVTEYINQLKELGVYENTTIIITADHGYWTITLDPIEETSTPIMFVKPEQSAEADALPIAVDEKPVSHLDLQATVLDAIGLDWNEYANREEWAGYSMFGPIDPDRKRYYLTTDSLPDLTEVQFREYLIDGNALDWENWHLTGRTIDAQE